MFGIYYIIILILYDFKFCIFRDFLLFNLMQKLRMTINLFNWFNNRIYNI